MNILFYNFRRQVKGNKKAETNIDNDAWHLDPFDFGLEDKESTIMETFLMKRVKQDILYCFQEPNQRSVDEFLETNTPGNVSQ